MWSTLASYIELEKQAILRSKLPLEPLDGLDRIPESSNLLTLEGMKVIQEYLEKVSPKIAGQEVFERHSKWI